MNILFVCAGNVQRSPTFEKYFKNIFKRKKCDEFRSAGTHAGYPFIVNEEILSWADKIYTMDLEQTKHIYDYFPKHKSKVETIGISDQYMPHDQELIRLIRFWLIKRGGYY
jgi:protein-tyrosine-phosphatase